MGLSPSALSHTLRSLEARIGARLLNRTTRSVALTEAGAALLARVAPAFTEIRGAVDAARGNPGQPAGTLRLNLPKLAARMLMPRSSRFAIAHPSIRLELKTENNFSDIVAEGFDAGIRPGESLQGDMVALRVTPDLRWAIVGAPGYCARHPPPRTPRDLASHLCINYRFTHSGGLYRWPFPQGDAAMDVAVMGGMPLDDTDLQIAAALEGAGIACTLQAGVEGYLAQGRLQRVLEDWCRRFRAFTRITPEDGSCRRCSERWWIFSRWTLRRPERQPCDRLRYAGSVARPRYQPAIAGGGAGRGAWLVLVFGFGPGH